MLFDFSCVLISISKDWLERMHAKKRFVEDARMLPLFVKTCVSACVMRVYTFLLAVS